MGGNVFYGAAIKDISAHPRQGSRRDPAAKRMARKVDGLNQAVAAGRGGTAVFAVRRKRSGTVFIPALGYWDDILLLPELVALTIRCLPKDILNEKQELVEAL